MHCCCDPADTSDPHTTGQAEISCHGKDQIERMPSRRVAGGLRRRVCQTCQLSVKHLTWHREGLLVVACVMQISTFVHDGVDDCVYERSADGSA